MADTSLPQIPQKEKCDLVCHLWTTSTTLTKNLPHGLLILDFPYLWAFPLRSGLARCFKPYFCDSHLKFIYPWLSTWWKGQWFLLYPLSQPFTFLQSPSTQGYTEQITSLLSKSNLRIYCCSIHVMRVHIHVMRVPWTTRRSNQPFLKKISPEYSLEGPMLKLKLQYFGFLMRSFDSLEKTLMLGKIEGRRKS